MLKFKILVLITSIYKFYALLNINCSLISKIELLVLSGSIHCLPDFLDMSKIYSCASSLKNVGVVYYLVLQIKSKLASLSLMSL